MMKKFWPLLFFITSCASQNGIRQTASNQSKLEEMRIALLDLRQAYSAQQMDIRLLEEKLEKAGYSSQKVAIPTRLDQKVKALEKSLNQISNDLIELKSHANQTRNSFIQYKNNLEQLEKQLKMQSQKFQEITNLKSTLHSISQAISSEDTKNIHIVQSGDTLEKIARKYHTSIDKVKIANNLTSSRIIIGQKLKIPE